MKRIGYIYKARHNATVRNYVSRQPSLELTEAYEDEECDEARRPKWRVVMSRLAAGDELYIASLSNVLREVSALPYFLGYVRKRGIRLVSLADNIDTLGVLYGDNTPLLFSVLSRLPSEIGQLRKRNRVERGQRKGAGDAAHRDQYDREASVINYYSMGYGADRICALVGYKSRASVYNILRRNNLTPHTRHKGYREEKKP